MPLSWHAPFCKFNILIILFAHADSKNTTKAVMYVQFGVSSVNEIKSSVQIRYFLIFWFVRDMKINQKAMTPYPLGIFKLPHRTILQRTSLEWQKNGFGPLHIHYYYECALLSGLLTNTHRLKFRMIQIISCQRIPECSNEDTGDVEPLKNFRWIKYGNVHIKLEH